MIDPANLAKLFVIGWALTSLPGVFLAGLILALRIADKRKLSTDAHPLDVVAANKLIRSGILRTSIHLALLTTGLMLAFTPVPAADNAVQSAIACGVLLVIGVEALVFDAVDLYDRQVLTRRFS